MVLQIKYIYILIDKEVCTENFLLLFGTGAGRWGDGNSEEWCDSGGDGKEGAGGGGEAHRRGIQVCSSYKGSL